MSKRVVVLPGDDAAPEAMGPAISVLRALELDIDFVEFPPGEQWVKGETVAQVRKAIDSSDSTLFGATSGKTQGIGYLRWGKGTYANVRPLRTRKAIAVRSKIPTASTSSSSAKTSRTFTSASRRR